MTPEQQKKYEEYRKIRMKLMDKHYPNGLPDIQQVLMEMSNYSGGWIDFLEDPEQADGIYSRILSEINTRYVIGYYPSNEAKDGKRRTVKIEVKNKKNYTIWGRKTYIAPLN